eukprot:6423524-Amphidinium_carterae.1
MTCNANKTKKRSEYPAYDDRIRTGLISCQSHSDVVCVAARQNITTISMNAYQYNLQLRESMSRLWSNGNGNL